MNVNKGRQLRLAREYRQLSQGELCKQVSGLSQPNLSRYESGYPTISDSKINQIMDILNFPLSWLDQHVGPLKTSLDI